jgi:hypothetical protein
MMLPAPFAGDYFVYLEIFSRTMVVGVHGFVFVFVAVSVLRVRVLLLSYGCRPIVVGR